MHDGSHTDTHPGTHDYHLTIILKSHHDSPSLLVSPR